MLRIHFTYLLVLVLIGVNHGIFAQQKSRNTLNMYNIGSYNPAVVGSTSYGDAFFNLRDQYWNLTDYNSDKINTSTQWFGIHMPIKRFNSGIGVQFDFNKIGFEDRKDINLNYAYQFKLGEGKLGLGINIGVSMFKFSLEDAIYPNGVNGTGSDTWLQERYGKMGEETINKFILGAGILYRSKDVYFGISSTQLNEPNFDFDNDEVDYIKRTYWVTAGYNYQTSNPLWVIKPSALLKANLNSNDGLGAIAQLSIDLLLQYNKFVVAGVSYTSSRNISPVLGVEISNGSKLDGLRMLAAYDFTWSDYNDQHAGSFELTIGYSFNLSIEKVTKSYKSVRFL